MDDHMLDRLYDEIKLIISWAYYQARNEEDIDKAIRQSNDWEAAKTLIRAYNKMVRLYYKPEYAESYTTGIKYIYQAVKDEEEARKN